VKNKIYTRTMAGSLYLGVTGEYAAPADDTFVTEEDMTLIGCELACWPEATVPGDSEVWCMTELSQSGVMFQSGIVARASAYATHWITVAADEDHHQLGVWVPVMFPSGTGITLPEGDTLYLNLSGRVLGDDCSAFYFSGVVILYLVKGLIT